ncbi:MAG: hypothetical protein WBR15_04970 [Gammaproteobacteria bacterium]
MPITPRITVASENLARIVDTNPMLLSDVELKILLSLGSDVVTINEQVVEVGPQTAKWISWKLEYDSRLMNRYLQLIKYSIIAAAIAAVSALVTAAITLIHCL